MLNDTLRLVKYVMPMIGPVETDVQRGKVPGDVHDVLIGYGGKVVEEVPGHVPQDQGKGD